MKSNWSDSIERFEELDLNPDLIRGIFGFGYEMPS